MEIKQLSEAVRVRVQAPGVPAKGRMDERPLAITEKQRELASRLDEFAIRLGGSEERFDTFFHKHPFGLRDRFIDAPFISALWPDGLFLPGDADWHRFWFLPPAAGTHRYTEAWLGGNGDAANHASAATGDVFAYASAAPTDTHLRSEASIGILFRPTATLAAYTVTVTPALTGFDRYDVNTNANAGGSVRKWGALDIAAYEINWVNGTTELVPPTGTTFLFNETFSNLTGVPIQHFGLNTPVSTNVLLEGGRDYILGVTALVQIDNGWMMNNGGPMQALPPGSTWTVWCAVQGTIVSVQIEATTVYQK